MIAVHRGGGKGPLENTPQGITLGLESGADAVEVDVRFSKDGRPIMYHDRMLNGKPINRYFFSQLRKMGIYSLEEALNTFDTTFLLDIKEIPSPSLIDMVDSNVIVISFNPYTLNLFSEVGIPTAVIISTVLPAEEIDRIAHMFHSDYVSLDWGDHLPPNYIDVISNIRSKVISWSENHEEVFKNLLLVADITVTDNLSLVKTYGNGKV